LLELTKKIKEYRVGQNSFVIETGNYNG